MSFMLPGFPRPIELPSNLSDADRAKAINAYLQSDAAKEFIDQDTGAPAFVRAQVGGSPTEDRLANIRRFYPDAAPYDDDNFIYTNPDTGRLTLYNPPGPLLRLLLPSGSRLWAGAITHAPWPLRRAKLVAYGGMCSAAGVLSAVGLSALVQGASVAHTSSGVGPIEFVWRGAG